MNHRTFGCRVLLAVIWPSMVAAQNTGPTFEAVVGLAHRSPTTQDLPLDGFQAAARVGYPLVKHLRLLAALTWTTYSDHDGFAAILCPQPTPGCGTGQASIPGLGMAAATIGLEPVLPLGGLEVRPSGMVGGFWLYHHASGLPDQAFGFDAGLALGLPIGARERILLEGRWVRLRGTAGSAGNSQRLNAGLALW